MKTTIHSKKRGVYKLTCNNCNKFYPGRITRNFKIGFNEHRKDSTASAGKSTFSEYILNAGHKMWPMEETMKILHFENDPPKESTLLKKSRWRKRPLPIKCSTSCRVKTRLQNTSGSNGDGTDKCWGCTNITVFYLTCITFFIKSTLTLLKSLKLVSKTFL